MLRELFQGELPRLVMFDLDGTLVDSVPDLAAAVDKSLLQLGQPAAGIEQVRDWVGNGARVLVRRALAGGLQHEHIDDADGEQALELFMQAYAEDHSLTRVYPGVLATLDWLRTQQVEMAIITNKPERFVAPLLDAKGLGSYFRWIIGGDTLPQQ
ncbi:HAD hydrolase-like protein, partial [Pseudomonas sp.]|uniref:HAD hydrolase-like protein n=1 Tax=Pseudomonas sp. TaxID=306 RepID=UPI003BB6D15B